MAERDGLFVNNIFEILFNSFSDCIFPADRPADCFLGGGVDGRVNDRYVIFLVLLGEMEDTFALAFL